jgi:hypothetical protein
MAKVLGFFHLKLQPDVDVATLEKFLREEAFPYWEQLPGLKCHLVQGREGTMLQAGEYYWVNEAESEKRHQGFLPTPNEEFQQHFDAGLPRHGETWERLIADFIYQGSLLVV